MRDAEAAGLDVPPILSHRHKKGEGEPYFVAVHLFGAFSPESGCGSLTTEVTGDLAPKLSNHTSQHDSRV